MAKLSKPKSELDTPWKKIMDLYFEQFIAYCWPARYHEIDWSKGYTMLDQELHKISRGALIGNRILDKLIKINRKNGEDAVIFIHLEIQGNPDPHFTERMFIYKYRLHDLYGENVVSLALLIDNNFNWRPASYSHSLWGCSVEMKFPIIKLLDFKAKLEELHKSTNIFATVILAQLAALEKQSMDAKLASKINLTRSLYNKGWHKNDILNLYTFVDWILALPKQLDIKYHKIVEQIEETLKVSYVTTAERIGIEKGKQQGIQQGIQIGEINVLMALLNTKFQVIPENLLSKINNADTDTLLKFAKRTISCQTVEEALEDD